MVTAAGAIRNKVQMLNVASANYKFAGFHLYLKYFRWQQLQLRVLCEAFILRWQQLQLRMLCEAFVFRNEIQDGAGNCWAHGEIS